MKYLLYFWRDAAVWFALFGVLIVCLAACSGSGETIATWRQTQTVTAPDGSVTTTETDSTATANAGRRAVAPPTINIGAEGVGTSGGTGEGTTTAMLVADGVRWPAVALIVGGVVASGLSLSVLPVVPLLPSIGAAAAGAALLMLPAVVPYMPWILGVLVLAAGLAWWHNRVNEKRGEQKTKRKETS